MAVINCLCVPSLPSGLPSGCRSHRLAPTQDLGGGAESQLAPQSCGGSLRSPCCVPATGRSCAPVRRSGTRGGQDLRPSRAHCGQAKTRPLFADQPTDPLSPERGRQPATDAPPAYVTGLFK
jgi:hypothetical protein